MCGGGRRVGPPVSRACRLEVDHRCGRQDRQRAGSAGGLLVVRHDGARLAHYDQAGGDAIRAVTLRTRPLRARIRNLSVPRAQRRGIRRVHRRPRSRIEGPPRGLPHPARRKRGGRIARCGTHHVVAAVDQGRLDPPRRGDRRRYEERAPGRSRSDVGRVPGQWQTGRRDPARWHELRRHRRSARRGQI